MFNSRIVNRRLWYSILIALIVLVALAVRLRGISFGLPYEYHVDEVQYTRQAASMGQEGLEPTWWNNPPFFKYLLFAEYGFLFLFGRIAGWYQSVSDFGHKLFFDPTYLYLLGRATSAVFGALTIVPTYFIGKAWHNKYVGGMAAFFLAFAFLHVRQSHFSTNDPLVIFLMTTGMLAAVKISRGADKKWYILGGITMGLGFATKYTAVFTAVPLLLAHLLSPTVQLKRPLKLQLPKLVLLGTCALLAAIIASPYFILTPRIVIRDVYEALILAGKQGFEGWELDPASGFIFYIKSLAWGLGWPLLLLALLGGIHTLIKRSKEGLIILAFCLFYYFMMGRQQMYFARFILPVVPMLLLLAAAAIYAAAAALLPRLKLQYTIALTILVLILVTITPAAASVRFDNLLLKSDTRTLAKQWIENNIPAGAKIATDWAMYGPPLSTPEEPRPDSLRMYDVTAIGGKGLWEHPLDWYRAEGYDYLIASSFIYNIPLQDKQSNAERVAFYESLDDELQLVYEIYARDNKNTAFIFDEIYGPAIHLGERQRPGPTIKIYALGG